MESKTKGRLLFVMGLILCFAVAGLSVLLEELIPGGLLGASIIALFMGTIINSFFHPAWMKPALKFTSKKVLKAAIVLLGASLSVNTILSVGKMTFFVMIFTFAMCFGGGFLLLAVLNSIGFIPAAVSGIMKSASKFLMVTALAAIGLGTSITDFKKAGLSPMFYGITIDTLVTLTALIVIWCMGLM